MSGPRTGTVVDRVLHNPGPSAGTSRPLRVRKRALRNPPQGPWWCWSVARHREVGRAGASADARRGVDADPDGGGACRRREDELAGLEVHVHVVARVELTLQDLLRQTVLDLVLHRAAQRPGAECGVEADLDQALLGGESEFDGHVPV